MKIQHNIPLKKYNSFRINANAVNFAEISRVEHIKQLIQSNIIEYPNFHILGAGCNTLFASNSDAIILQNSIKSKLEIKEQPDTYELIASSGFMLDEVIKQFLNYQRKNKLKVYGLENLAKIPSQVGSAVVQNVGAYGIEQSAFFVSCCAINMLDGKEHTFTADDCSFGYRTSRFKVSGNPYFITEATYSIPKNNAPNTAYPDLYKALGKIKSPAPSDIYAAVAKIRDAKLPDVNKYPNTGSFFRNPVVSVEKFAELLLEHQNIPNYQEGESVKLNAAWLIDICGLKGKRIKDVGLFEKQSLCIVNYGDATAKDIIRFANEIIFEVNNKFGIILEPEIVFA